MPLGCLALCRSLALWRRGGGRWCLRATSGGGRQLYPLVVHGGRWQWRWDPASPFPISSFLSLYCRWILCSSSAPKDTTGVDKERRRSKMLQAASWVGAHPRWCSWRGNGTRDGGQLPAFTATPSTLLAEGRPYLFLLAWMPKGRQVRFCSESIASSSGELACRRRSGGDHGDPSGSVPGVVVVGADRNLCWTRLLFPISVQGPLCKSQGLLCNFFFLLGPVVICTATSI